MQWMVETELNKQEVDIIIEALREYWKGPKGPELNLPEIMEAIKKNDEGV